MRSYRTKCDIDLEALDSYLKENYPVEIISSSKNVLKFKIVGFYKLVPIPPFIFQDAIVSIKYDETSGFSTVTFSLFSCHFISLFLVSLFISLAIATGCNPKNFFELFVFFIILFPLFFFPYFYWSWIKHERLISILSKKP